MVVARFDVMTRLAMHVIPALYAGTVRQMRMLSNPRLHGDELVDISKAETSQSGGSLLYWMEKRWACV